MLIISSQQNNTFLGNMDYTLDLKNNSLSSCIHNGHLWYTCWKDEYSTLTKWTKGWPWSPSAVLSWKEAGEEISAAAGKRALADISSPGNGHGAFYLLIPELHIFYKWYQQFFG